MKVFSAPSANVHQVPQCPISKLRPLILLPTLFQRISQPKGHDQQNAKQTYCRFPN